ncbi:MAG: penicillin acylase family protein [Cellvibrionaceae bacterium]
MTHSSRSNVEQNPFTWQTSGLNKNNGEDVSKSSSIFKYGVVLTLIGLAVVLAWSVTTLQFSLAKTDGELELLGLDHPVIIERDDQGIPTLISDDRLSVAYGLGFVHAQERFFQMDLLRRNSAGELSELVGEATLEHDQAIRRHRLRYRAERNLQQLPESQLELLHAYARGANAGLANLDSKPFEYHLLGTEPQTWQAADSLLVLFSMYMTLQDESGETEYNQNLMAEVLPKDLYDFLQPLGGKWDAPLLGESYRPAPIPVSGIDQLTLSSDSLVYQPLLESDDYAIGSNNWAVGGALTQHGSAIVADDMHLSIQVPNIWYRASWPLANGLTMTGASLPGTPAMIVGSNGKVAWGFTNTTGDWGDWVLLDTDENVTHYQTPDGAEAFQLHEEIIHVKGAESQTLVVKETRWGPLLKQNHRGQWMAFRWVAHDPEGANMNLIGMESVTSIEQALPLASTFGTPAQNFVGGDDQGNIGWTVAGRIPERKGFDGTFWRSWAEGEVDWLGYLEFEDYPKVYNPDNHRIWTANARTMSGEYLRLMGSGANYALGARQQQIRDALLARDQFTEQDLLDIQLDDRALFLTPWHQHLTALIESSDRPLLHDKESLLSVMELWGAKASADSVGYRLVRNFRLKTIEYAMAPFVTALTEADESFQFKHVKRSSEYPVWAMITEQPSHLLNPEFDSWQALQLAALDEVLNTMAEDGVSLSEQTWGRQNSAKIIHPLVKAVPALGIFLSMPNDRLSGDSHMPRVQTPTNGASERMVVTPGQEEKGIFHMATGQSGHPLSDWFDAGHRDWVDGNASAFLPAETQHKLILTPAVNRPN